MRKNNTNEEEIRTRAQFRTLANKYAAVLAELENLKEYSERQERLRRRHEHLVENLLRFLKLKAAFDPAQEIFRFKQLPDLLPDGWTDKKAATNTDEDVRPD